ncbi:MAG: phenylacetate-CoA oxygenase subunit PaaI [Chloroflexota bacterium]|nr:phenylacetate-CoA oxygenase subunit PaaI [Chloroflexota bacterium]
MFTDKIEAQDVPKMEPEYQDLLKRVLAIQADCEIGGPHLYVKDILLNAPTPTEQLIVARTAAEEIDHYRKFAKLAAELGVDVSYVLRWSNQKRYVEAFRGQISTWEDYAIFGFLIDRVGRYQLEEFMDSSYEPLNRILPVILKEEEGHIAHGHSSTAALARQDEAARWRIQEALNRWYSRALDMFGNSGSHRSERYCHWGLKRRANEQARQQYAEEVNPQILEMGLEVPDGVAGRHYF